MDYLKKFLSINLFALYGYWVFIKYLSIYPQYDNIFAYTLNLTIHFVYFLMQAKYFFITLCIEFCIIFILKLIFKKEIGLNLKNTIYDIIFRLGIFLSFVPIALILTFGLIIPMPFLLPSGGDITDASLFALCFTIFDAEIRYIFFKKYFVK